ncbi:MAG: putative quinol monooxygenase [Thermoleophilia bacterium]
MIVVAGSITLHPERLSEAFERAAVVADATRSEAGCISYTFFRHLERDDAFFVFEEWEAREHLDAHLAAPHTAAFSAFLGEAMAAPPKLRVYEVARAGSL